MYGLQRKLEMIGKSGCYFLCFLRIFHIQDEQVIRMYDYLTETGVMSMDCTILDSGKLCYLLSKWTGEDISYLGKVTSYSAKEGEVILRIGYWNDQIAEHFAVVDKNGDVIFDPLGDSKTLTRQTKPNHVRLLVKRV